jgi:hypothetical protein
VPRRSKLVIEMRCRITICGGVRESTRHIVTKGIIPTKTEGLLLLTKKKLLLLTHRGVLGDRDRKASRKRMIAITS